MNASANVSANVSNSSSPQHVGGKKGLLQRAAIAPTGESPKRPCFESQHLLGQSGGNGNPASIPPTPIVTSPNANMGTSTSDDTAQLLPDANTSANQNTSFGMMCSGSSLLQKSPHDSVSSGTSRNWFKVRAAVSATNAIAMTKPSVRAPKKLEREDSFLRKFSTQAASTVTVVDLDASTTSSGDTNRLRKLFRCISCKFVPVLRVRGLLQLVIQPKSWFMFVWLGVVTLAVLYNWWTTIAREAFPELVDDHLCVWIVFDVLFDLIYVFDVLIQLKTGCFEKGIMVRDPRKVALVYLRSRSFVLDALSVLPLDLLQIWIGLHPLLRFPRFLKMYRCLEWNQMVENWTPFPNFWRVLNLSHVVFLGCHWFAAFYYLISQAEGFSSKWGYPEPKDEFESVTRKYLKSLYWSTLTLTTIGDLLPPESNWQHIFTIGTYLIGVFVFASIVGQVGNVINNRNQSRQEFETLLDNAKSYMRTHSVPSSLQRRVQRWYEYAWNRGKLNGGGDLYFALGMLPFRLKTEIALHVNLETLKKVTIFQSCRPEFLHDLVLKMKTLICCEGDFVCRKGEVAREMFIIADGILEVISEAGEVVSKMSSGDFFGEIGILNLEGGVNRRTADVRSVGYSELFVLSRDDVLDALKDHPDAEAVIREYGIRRLREMAARKAKTPGSATTPVQGVGQSGEQERERVAISKTHSFSSTVENISRSASSTNLSVVPAPLPAPTQASGETPSAQQSAATNEVMRSAKPPESLTHAVSQLRSRRPFQVAQSSRMPFIDEDSGETSRDSEVAQAPGFRAPPPAAERNRSSSIAAALRQVAAMSAMPVLSKEHRRRYKLRSRRSNWSITESKFIAPLNTGEHVSRIVQARKDSMSFLTDARIAELQFENDRKQQQIDALLHRIGALQRLVIRNCEVFDVILGSTGSNQPNNNNSSSTNSRFRKSAVPATSNSSIAASPAITPSQ